MPSMAGIFPGGKLHKNSGRREAGVIFVAGSLREVVADGHRLKQTDGSGLSNKQDGMVRLMMKRMRHTSHEKPR